MSESQIITVAGQVLAEVRSMQPVFGQHDSVANAVRSYFAINGRIGWQIGCLRFEQLVDRLINELDILPDHRQDLYRQTFSNNVKGIVSPERFQGSAGPTFAQLFDQLTMERLENFHDTLLIGGRSFSLERARCEVAIDAVSELIAELDSSETEVDQFIIEKLTDLLRVLERYELFGADGVKDYVDSLIGSVATGVLSIGGPLSDEARSRVLKVMSVAKGALDGFVYLAQGIQTIEWANAHVLAIAGPTG